MRRKYKIVRKLNVIIEKSRQIIGNKRYIVILFVSVLLLISLMAFSMMQKPDWRALYSDHLNRQIVEFDESFMNREYYDVVEMGALTRVAWAKLDDGSVIFLGLPPYGTSTDEVIDRTVILWDDEWKRACENASGEKIMGWSWMNEHRGNSLRVNIFKQNQSQSDSYCEFYYLSEGWELRAVYINGILKPYDFP